MPFLKSLKLCGCVQDPRVVIGGNSETYESDEQEQDLEAPPDGGLAVDVAVAHSGHGHHEEVHAVPVAQLLGVVKVRRVALVLQLWLGFFSGRGGGKSGRGL